MNGKPMFLALAVTIQNGGKYYGPEEEYHIDVQDSQLWFDKSQIDQRRRQPELPVCK